MHRKKVLFLSAVACIGGAERVLTHIAEYIPAIGYIPVLVTQEEGPLCDFFREKGGKVFILKLPAWRKGRNFFTRYAAVLRLDQIVRREKIVCIHCNSYRLNPYALYTAKAAGIPFLTHVHDIIEKKHCRNFLLTRAAFLAVPSRYAGRGVNGCPGKIFVVANGVDVEKYDSAAAGDLRGEFGIDNDVPLAGMIAHFMRRKGHARFISAAALVKKSVPKAKFVIIGDDVWGSGLTGKELKEYAEKKNIAGEVIFTGTREDVPAILKSLDVLVLPADDEPFGLAVIEAMAAGVPVIVHKGSGGPCEIISDGEDGLIADCDDARQFAEKIKELFSDCGLKTRLINAARETVRGKYGMGPFREKISAMYDEIIKGYVVKEVSGEKLPGRNVPG